MWDVESVPPGDVVVSDVPALIMEGVYDANKPPELGAEVAENFGTSYLAEFGGTAHVTLSPCGISMMAEFMNDPSQSPDMSCVPDSTSFVPPAGALWGLIRANLALVILGIAALMAIVGGVIWLIRHRRAKQPA
jgi:hypothetical protein